MKISIKIKKIPNFIEGYQGVITIKKSNFKFKTSVNTSKHQALQESYKLIGERVRVYENKVLNAV